MSDVSVAKPYVPGSNAATLSNMIEMPFEYLTPETLLHFCQMKLQGIDAEVQRAMAGQKSRNNTSEALSALAKALNSVKGGVAKGGEGHDARETVRNAYKDAIAKVGPDTPLGKQLAAERDRFERTATGNEKNHGEDGGDDDVLASEMESFSEFVSNCQQDASRDGELEMIRLQQLMSQRQQALQMCTNMVQSVGQSSNAIAQNIGK